MVCSMQSPVTYMSRCNPCRFHQGPIRMSRYNPFEGFLASESVGRDIIVSGKLELNRAMDGDVAVVELLPQEQWRGEARELPQEVRGLLGCWDVRVYLLVRFLLKYSQAEAAAGSLGEVPGCAYRAMQRTSCFTPHIVPHTALRRAARRESRRSREPRALRIGAWDRIRWTRWVRGRASRAGGWWASCAVRGAVGATAGACLRRTGWAAARACSFCPSTGASPRCALAAWDRGSVGSLANSMG